MKLYNMFLVNAKERAKELLDEYNKRNDGSSFSEWMGNYYENMSEILYAKATNNAKLIKDYQDLIQQTDTMKGDTFDVEETQTNRNGIVSKKIVTYSKSQLTKDIIKADEFNTDDKDFNKKLTAYEFETRLGAYIYAKNKIDARPWYSKAFFFWRTYKESKMLDTMKENLTREYELTDTQLDTMMRVINNDAALEATESISEGGFRTLIPEERRDFLETKMAARNVKISDDEAKEIIDYQKDEAIIDDLAIDDKELNFDENDIIPIKGNNSLDDDEIITFDKEELKKDTDNYKISESENNKDKTSILREFLNEEFDTSFIDTSKKTSNKNKDEINISIDKK